MARTVLPLAVWTRRSPLARQRRSMQARTAAGDRLAPHIVNVSIIADNGRTVDGEMLLLALDMDGVLASSGAACSSGTVRPSHVLRAVGHQPDELGGLVRFSLGKDTSKADVDYAVDRLLLVVNRMLGAETAS